MIGLNVDLNVNNIDDKYDSKESEDRRRTSSAVITEDSNQEIVPKTYVTVRSPFTKSNTTNGENNKSPDMTSIDSNKDNDSLWRAEKFIPDKYQMKTEASNRKSRFKLIRMDWQEFNGCGTYCRFVTIILCLFIIIILILDITSEETDDNEIVGQFHTNETIIELNPEKEEPIIESSIFAEMFAKNYLLTICVVTIIVEIILVMSYSLHVVEVFITWPWLLFESSYSILSALHFFFLSIWNSLYGLWCLVVAIIGIIITIIFIVWAIIKVNKYRSGRRAQRGTDDPDGDTLRRLSPNIRFSTKDKQIDHILKDQTKVNNNEDIFY